MKKIAFVFALMAMVSLAFWSCNKNDYDTQQSDAIDRYLKTNNKDSSFIDLGNNCYIKIVKEGDSDYEASDIVEMTYTGSVLQNGVVFDSDRTFSFVYGDCGLVRGFYRAMPYIKRNSENVLIVPYSMAYGEKRLGLIEPYSTLLFKFKVK